jgi:hypothetical protein
MMAFHTVLFEYGCNIGPEIHLILGECCCRTEEGDGADQESLMSHSIKRGEPLLARLTVS